MRSLEIRTQRIFNNLIKQNQKLASDFVLKMSTIVSSVQSPASRVQSPKSGVQSPVSRVQGPKSDVQSPVFRVQDPESGVQSPASRVQRPTLASRAQKFWYVISVLLSVRIKRKRFAFNRKRLFYFKEKPTTPLPHESRNIKKHTFQ